MTNTNKQFNNLKTWLKNNNIYFEKGFSTYDNEHDIHDFVIIPSAFAHVYNDEQGLTFDSDNRLSTYENNKELYTVIKKEIENGGN